MPGRTGVLDQLNPEQRALLLSWLDLYPTREVLERVATPPPEGFGIQTHITSLRRFYEYAQRDLEAEVKEAALQSSNCELSLMLERATSALLLRRAFSLAGSPQGNGQDFEKAGKCLLALQKQRFLQQQLELEKQRLELDAKRAELFAVLAEAKTPYPNEAQKISAARQRLYGK